MVFRLRINSEACVVVSVEVVSPEGLTVYIVVYAVLEVGVVAVAAAGCDGNAPVLSAVAVGLLIVEGYIIEALPAVGGVSYLDVLLISVVLQGSGYLISGHVGIAGSVDGDGSSTELLGGGVLAVVVVPDGVAVADILDRVLGVVAGDVSLPELGTVVERLDELSLRVVPLVTLEVVVVNGYFLLLSVVLGLDLHIGAGAAVLAEVGFGVVHGNLVGCCAGGSGESAECAYENAQYGNNGNYFLRSRCLSHVGLLLYNEF